MPEIFYQPVFGEFRFIDVMVAVALVVGVGWLLGKLFGGKAKAEQIAAQTARFKCHVCGWEGTGSKHTLRCPKCNNKAYAVTS